MNLKEVNSCGIRNLLQLTTKEKENVGNES
jgi:hypothetical protein